MTINTTKGIDPITGLYTTRYYARNACPGDCVVVNVCAGYTIMTAADYNACRHQRSPDSHSHPARVAGLFFCLAPAESAGLLFCPAAIQPNTSLYSAFCAVNAVIPPTPQNSARGFASAFIAICRVLPLLCDGASSYTAMPAPRWSVSQRRSASSAYQRPDATPDTAQVSTAAYHASPAESARTIFGSLASADTLPAV